MLPPELTIALKEWAVVQRALLEGRQTVLLRKGGIIEETGDFDLKAREFLLYPTYDHQTERAGDIRPEFLPWLAEEEERKPAPVQVRIEAAAEVVDVVRLDGREALFDREDSHIWSRQFINARFEWEPYKPIFLLTVRAYRLVQPHVLAVLPSYGGCRSWITLATAVDSRAAEIVIPAHGSPSDFRK